MKKWLLFLLLAAAVVLGVLAPLTHDAAHNATMALRMAETGDYTSLIDSNNASTTFAQPYLQFWLAALSFKWFGVGGVAYKISSLLFVILTLLSTFKLGEYLAPRKGVGSMAAFLLMSMAAFMLSSSGDIRANAILTGAVAFAIWQGVVCIGGGGIGGGDNYGSRRTLDRFRLMPHLGLSLGMALAMWCDGMYGVIIIVVAMYCYMLASRRAKWLISWRPLIVVGIFALLILPEQIAYYLQFGWQGVRLTLFKQMLLNTHSNASVLAISPLWVTLPWTLLLIFFSVRSLLRRQIDSIYSLTVITSALILILLLLLPFKQPQHLIPLLPLLAIFLADSLHKIEIRTPLLRGVSITQKTVVAATVIIAIALNYFAFPFDKLWMAIVYGAALLFVVYSLWRPWTQVDKIFSYTIAASAVLWIGLNANFYPQLLKLQPGTELGAMCKVQGIKPFDVAILTEIHTPSFDINHGATHRQISKANLTDSTFAMPTKYILVDRLNYRSLASDSVFVSRNAQIIKRIPNFRTTNLSLQLLNPSTRLSLIDTLYLVEIPR